MRKSLYASVLVLALCGSSFAGDMGCPPAPGDTNNPPSAPLSTGVQNTNDMTDTSTSSETVEVIPSDNADDFAATALSVINSVLALL
jgi:hypothetical protein